MRNSRVAVVQDTREEVGEEPLHTKYRPQDLHDVIGQKEVVGSLEKLLKSKTRPHAFLFTGPAGTGKTTLARIVMKRLGCDQNSIIEADAASNNGIDSMRALTEGLRYQGFGERPNKGIIIDEAHSITKAAWSSLLKSVEEPPSHVFWVFCTTEAAKVPEAIVTRCHAYNLRSVRTQDIEDLLERVAEAECMDVIRAVDQSISMVAQACSGSPRQALVMLSMIRDCRSAEEVARLLESPGDNAEIIELCRLLLNSRLDWQKVTSTLSRIEGVTAESARIVIANYMSACLMKCKSDKEARNLLDLAHPFSKPFVSTDKLLPLLVAFGDVLYA